MQYPTFAGERSVLLQLGRLIARHLEPDFLLDDDRLMPFQLHAFLQCSRSAISTHLLRLRSRSMGSLQCSLPGVKARAFT